jgi:hypothetical protein
MGTRKRIYELEAARERLRRTLSRMQSITPEQSIVYVLDAWDSALVKEGWPAEPRTVRQVSLAIEFMRACPPNDAIPILWYAATDWIALCKDLEHYYGCWGIPTKPNLETIVEQAGPVVTWAMETKGYVPPDWPLNDWPSEY